MSHSTDIQPGKGDVPLPPFRIGLGTDLHRLEPGRPLVLGGVTIPFDRGPAGHSDGDVLIHALCDALLGALALRDIGYHFPDTSPELKGVASLRFLQEVMAKVKHTGWSVGNIDATIHLEKPKLKPYIDEISSVLAHELHTDIGRVSVKAKTGEGVGPVGEGRAVEALVVCLLIRD
jgi:2-C-methyl-D-erythritol 2,4-cyclodiphosphate synthase